MSAPRPEAASVWPAPPKYWLEPRRRPPPPPPDGAYTMYGVARPPLGEMPPAAPLEQQLYAAESDDPCGELKKLNHDLLRTFLALLQSAQDAPSQSNARVDEMRHLMLNMQHLLNTFRPYQAREELIAIAEAQVEAKRALLEECRAASAACAVRPPVEDGGGGSSSSGVGAEAEAEEDDVDATTDRYAADFALSDAREELLKAAGLKQASAS